MEIINQSKGRVLEVGVGTGLSLPTTRGISEIVGIDLSPEMLEKARERVAAERLANVAGLHEMDASDLKFPTASFDTVVAMYVADGRARSREGHARAVARMSPGRRGDHRQSLQRRGRQLGWESMRGWVERRMAPFADKLGWRPVFDIERVLVCEDLTLVEKRGLRPWGLFTMMRFHKAEAAQSGRLTPTSEAPRGSGVASVGSSPVSEPVAARRVCRSPSARRRKVETSTAAARTAATLPETFDTPPARRRCPTGTSSVRRPGGRHASASPGSSRTCSSRHAEALQRIAADGAEGRHVGEARAVKKADEQAGQMPRHDLRRRQAARLTVSGQARSQHEVGTAALDGVQHRQDHLGPIAAVAVDEEDDGVVRRDGGDARHHGAAIAPSRLDHDPRTGSSRALDRAILSTRRRRR